MCEFFGVSRAAYYAWVKHLEQPDLEAERKQLIQEVYEKPHKIYGYRRISLWIRNHKAVLRLMNRLNIHSVARKRKIYRKVTELGTYPRYENVLNRQFTATQPNQKWVTDITYIATQQAQQKEKVTEGLILHSDPGTQYSSQAYHDVLTQEYNITPSLSQRGNCWDHAPMENFFGHLKEEYLRQFKQTTFQETEQLIDEHNRYVVQ